MTIRYVGIGGSDSNDGLSWANRKLTLNGVEDTPVVMGDTVYIGSGTYREQLTCDVAGSAGNIITYIGDVTGEHTDGVGGIVRITGSDDDITMTRSYGILDAVAYRTFRGLSIDSCTTIGVYINSKDHVIIEDCNINHNVTGIQIGGANSNNNTIRRCQFFCNNDMAVFITHSSQVVGATHLIENCLFFANVNAIWDVNVEGIIVKNCSIIGNANMGIRASTSTGATQITVNNCILASNTYGLYAANVDQIAENYNTLWASSRTNTNTGANSNAYPPFINPPVLLATIKYLHNAFTLAPYSPIRGIAGTSEATEDVYGISRPATASKKSWGAVQYDGIDRSATQTHAGTYSMRLTDAKRVQFIVPVSAVSTTISVYVYREANYAGTNPQMIIRQPGQSARTTTDTGSSGGWNQLTDTFTPASSPPYVIVELVSNNMAISGSFNVYFDDLQVS